MKVCRDCKEQKAYSEFYKAPAHKDGHFNYCKPCMYLRKKKYISSLHGRLQTLLTSSKSSAKKNGWDFDMDLESLVALYEIQNGECALTGDELTFSQNSDAVLSIDRIDSDKGYTMDNIQLVSHQANIHKNHFTQDQLIEFCKKVVKKHAS